MQIEMVNLWSYVRGSICYNLKVDKIVTSFGSM